MTIPVNPMPSENRLFTNITPFTTRDNATYIIVLEGMRQYINDKLVPFINTNIANLDAAWAEQATQLVATFNELTDEAAGYKDQAALSQAAAEAARDLAELYSSTVEAFQDTAIANIGGNVNSQTRALFDSLYASVPALNLVSLLVADINGTIETGRLSPTQLNASINTLVSQGLIPVNASVALLNNEINTGRLSEAQLAATIVESVETNVGPLVEDAIANDATLIQAAIDALAGSAVAEGLTATIRLITAADNFNSLPSGLYYVPLGSLATGLGLPIGDHGLLAIISYGSASTGAGAAYFMARFNGSIYRAARSNGVWGAWQENVAFTKPQADAVAKIFPYRLTTAADNNFAALTSGDYYVPFGSHATALGLPVSDHGLLTVVTYGTEATGAGAAYFKPRFVGGEWRAMRVDGVWGAWVKDAGESAATDNAIRHAFIRDRHEIDIQAPIVTAPTPYVFLWDDYPSYMRDNGIVSLAQEYEIPIQFALCSRTLEPEYAPTLGGLNITAAEINQWIASGIMELSNHGATHRFNLTEADFYDEIVTGLSELRALYPGKPITTWAMPTNGWQNFAGGVTADQWAGLAGQLILGNHVYATGKAPIISDVDRSMPMTGKPIQGQDRIWVEGVGMTMPQRKTLLTGLYGSNRGAIFSAHADRIGIEGRWTLAEVEQYFAFLKEEKDAGRAVPMHLSQFPWAQKTV